MKNKFKKIFIKSIITYGLIFLIISLAASLDFIHNHDALTLPVKYCPSKHLAIILSSIIISLCNVYFFLILINILPSSFYFCIILYLPSYKTVRAPPF